jgi:hypothetical protein
MMHFIAVQICIDILTGDHMNEVEQHLRSEVTWALEQSSDCQMVSETDSQVESEVLTSSVDRFCAAVGFNLDVPQTTTATRRPASASKRKKCKAEAEQQVQLYKSLAYQNSKMPCFIFWRQFSSVLPDLSEIAKLHLSAPATSVPSESAFSEAGYLKRKQRASLSADKLCKTMFLKDKM